MPTRPAHTLIVLAAVMLLAAAAMAQSQPAALGAAVDYSDFARLSDAQKDRIIWHLHEDKKWGQSDQKSICRDILLTQCYYSANAAAWTIKAIDLAESQGWNDLTPLIDGIYQRPRDIWVYERAFRYLRKQQSKPIPSEIVAATKVLARSGNYKNTVTDEEVRTSQKQLLGQADDEAVLVYAVNVAGGYAGKGGSDRGRKAAADVLKSLNKDSVNRRVRQLYADASEYLKPEILWLAQYLNVDLTQQPAAAPASQPATASAPAPLDPAAERLLDALEQAGKKYATLTADIDYAVRMPMTGEEEFRTGTVALQTDTAAGGSKFRVSFLTLKQEDGPAVKDPVDYAFTGQWLTVAKHRIKQMTRYQVAAEGQHIEPLRLGKGPFPLPFGQKKEDVVKYFSVATRPAGPADPANTDYLKLATREPYRKEMTFVTLEMWVDRASRLPIKIISVDRNRSDVTTVLFKNLQTNKELPADLFNLPKPPGWELRIEPLEKATPR